MKIRRFTISYELMFFHFVPKGYWIGMNPKEINGTIKRLGDFTREVDNARTGLAFATIQMRSVKRSSVKGTFPYIPQTSF